MVFEDRVGFDCGFPDPEIVECLNCGLSLPFAKALDFPTIVNIPTYMRVAGEPVIATGYCPRCSEEMRTAFTVPINEPERMLF